MSKSRPKYTSEFRREMVELANKFDCMSWSIRQWFKQADDDASRTRRTRRTLK